MAWRSTLQIIRSQCMKFGTFNTLANNLGPQSSPRMRFIQFLRKNDNRKRLGVVSEDGCTLVELSGGSCVSNDMITFIHQDMSMEEITRKTCRRDEERINDSLKLLPPITNPGKIVCIGLNYKDHCEEQNKAVPKEPIFFSKFNTCLVGPTDSIIAHRIARKVDWEIELGVVVGKKAHLVTRERAMDYVFGYTIAQDITSRDWQKRNGGQFLIGKSMDTFCPLGPAIVHKSLINDVNNLTMLTLVNGVEKQNSNTSQMIFKIDDIISRLSQSMTLEPGDLILTGTPNGVGTYRCPPEYLQPGDVVESRIKCLGKMINTVVSP